VVISALIVGVFYYRSLYIPPPLKESELKDVGLNYIKLSDGRFQVWYEFGPKDGIPFLMFSGIPFTQRFNQIWEDTFIRLNIRCIAPNFYPIGYHDYLVGGINFSPLNYTKDFLELLEHLNIPKLPIAGFSGGVMWAMAFAHDYPDRVSRMLLFAPVFSRSYWEELVPDRSTDVRVFCQITRFPVILNTILGLAEIYFNQNITAAIRETIKGSKEEEELIFSARRWPILVKSWEEAFLRDVRPFSKFAHAWISLFNDWGFDVSKVKVPTLAVTGEYDNIHHPEFVKYLKKNNPDLVTDMIIPKGTNLAPLIYLPEYFEKLIFNKFKL